MTCAPSIYSQEQGGGLLADLILGHEPVCAVEWDPYCCAVLRERAADGWFPGLHVHEGDVRLFDPSEWAGRVDCIAAGFPCQDISVAGSGQGIDGERSGLYREVFRIADAVRPRFLFLENSPAIVSRGLGRVLGDLAARGYDARWTVLAAGDVGAPHQRERWWCLGWRNADGRKAGGDTSDADQDGVFRERGKHHQKERETRALIGDTGGTRETSDAPRIGRGEGWAESDAGREAITVKHCGSLGEPSGQRLPQRQGPDGERAHTTAMRAGWWDAEPDVGRVAHGLAARTHQIKALGNGQVPLCAAVAWRILGGPVT